MRSYHSIPLEKRDFRRRHSLRTAHTLTNIALSCYVSAFNKSTNDRASSLIEEPKLKDRFDIWKNLSNLSTLLCETDMKSYQIHAKINECQHVPLYT